MLTKSIVPAIAACLSMLLVMPQSYAEDNSARINLHRVNDWKIVNRDEIVISTSGRGGKKYLATLFGHCYGLTTAETIAFVPKGGSHIDSFSSIILPDGTRCRFKSLVVMPEKPPIKLQDENIRIDDD